jgi:hypothetical protein
MIEISKLKRDREFTPQELWELDKLSKPQLQTHIDNMAIEELKELAMSILGVCPICKKVSQKQFINNGMYGECMNCPEK